MRLASGVRVSLSLATDVLVVGMGHPVSEVTPRTGQMDLALHCTTLTPVFPITYPEIPNSRWIPIETHKTPR